MIFEFLAVFRMHLTVHSHTTHRVAAISAQRAPEVTRRLVNFEMIAHLSFGDANKIAKDAAEQRTVDDVVR